MYRHLLLVGSIGENTSKLQIYSVIIPSQTFEHGSRAPGTLLVEHTLYNQQFNTFISMIHFFLSLANVGEGMGATNCSNVSVACFAVSGPVDRNRVTLLNRSNWILDEKDLSEQLCIPLVRLINDFYANGYAILTLNSNEYVNLQDAPVRKGAPMAIIGACNGLGQCYLTCDNGDGSRYVAWPSEGGHCEFAPKTELQIELLQWLKSQFKELNRVSVERVVSRTGLVNCYKFLSEKYPEMINKAVHFDFQQANDKVSLIFKHSSTDKLCHKAVEILVETYGSEAGCAALKILPYGGLYIAGTIALKCIHRLQSDTSFMDAYYDKGRVNTLMRQVPVRVVLVEDLVLRGAHVLAFRILADAYPDNNSMIIRKRTLSWLFLGAAAATSLFYFLKPK